MKFWLKGCPRCHGDLSMRSDVTGPYVECMQCGMELSPLQESFLRWTGNVPEDLAPMEAPPLLAEGRRHSA